MAEAGLCRVTLIAPRMRLDIAVPAEVPLATLLPTLLWHSGEQLADEGLAQGGWAVQRVGEGPLDPSRSVAALGVRDGDVLYLRPREQAMPEPVFDDVVDAITTTLRDRARRWGPAASRAAAGAAIGALLAAAAIALAVAGGVLSSAGAGSAARAAGAVTGAAIAAGAVLAAAAASRALGDAAIGTVLALGALPAAFVAGLLALGRPGHAGPGVTAAGFLVACTALLVVAACGAVAVGPAAPMLTGAVVAGFVGVVGGLLAVFTSGAGAAAATVSLALVATPAIAPVAYRMARLPRPVVPATPEELRQRGDAASLAQVPARTVAADRVVGALAAATGVTAVVALAIMLSRGGWAPSALAGVASGLLLLRARLFTGLVARGWLLGAGLAGVALLLVAVAGRLPPAAIAAAAGVAAIAAAIVARAVISPRRPSPSLVRVVDLVELLATIATVPLALAVLGVYGRARGLGG